VLALDPGNIDAALTMAEVHAHTGNGEKALGDVDGIINRQPNRNK